MSYQQGYTADVYGTTIPRTTQAGGFTVDVYGAGASTQGQTYTTGYQSGAQGQTQGQKYTTGYQSGVQTQGLGGLSINTYSAGGDVSRTSHTQQGGYTIDTYGAGEARTETRASVRGQGRIIGERYITGESMVVGYEYGEEIRKDIRPASQIIQRADLTVRQNEPEIREEIEYVPVDVVVEEKVPVKKYVDVPYDVVVTKPKKKIVEKKIIVEKVKEVPVERVVEFDVQKTVKVPVEQVVEQEVHVEKIIDIPIQRINEHQVAQMRTIDQVHENHITLHVNELAEFRRKQAVHQVLPTDVRVTREAIYNQVPQFSVGRIDNQIDAPQYKLVADIKKVEIPQEIIVTNEVPQFDIEPKNNIVRVPVENVVERHYDIVHDKPVFDHNTITKTVTKVNEVIVEEPYTVERVNDAPNFYFNEEAHTVINKVPVNKYKFQNIKKEVIVPYVTPVQLPEVQVQGAQIKVQQPQQGRVQVDTQEIVYNLTKERPVPQNNQIRVRVPQFNRIAIDNVVEVQVPCHITHEQPVAVEKIVEVPVTRTVEQPEYIEQTVEIEVPVDVIIEREIEVLKQRYVDVPVDKTFEVPVKITQERPQENRQEIHVDINVNKTVYNPVRGGVVGQGKHEVVSEELAHKIEEMRQQVAQLSEQNKHLQAEFGRLGWDRRGVQVVNEAIKKVAQQSAALHELENRKNLVEQDIQRLQQILSSGQIQATHSISYTVPHPDTQRLAQELQRLADENRRLVQQIKQKAQQAGH